MKDERNENMNYGNNFVMRDPQPGDDAENAHMEPRDTTRANQSDSPDAYGASEGTHYTGSFRDPRENFRGGRQSENFGYTDAMGQTHGQARPEQAADYTTADQASHTAAGQAQPEQSAGQAENHTTAGQSAEEQTYSASGASASWDNHNGLGRVHRKKPSKPVTLTRKTLALLIALCIFCSAGFGIGGAALGSHLLDDGSSSGSSGSVSDSGYTLTDATGSDMTVQEITELARPSVVEIKTESVASDSWMQQYVTEGAGSGVIITEDGYIVTNNHVIEGASNIMVTTADGKEYDAELVGTDSITDVAVIKIDADGLTAATYGNSDQLAVGDMAVAIGNPLGELGGTVTAGIISALDRELSIDGKTMTLLQTDSSINPGNSGGGLFNSDGQLIGIVVAKSSGSDVEGLGFAIPINKAADSAQQIMDKGYVSGQPSTGMAYTESSAQSSIDMLLNGGQGGGSVYIAAVEGDNAKAAGFREGDMVYAVDDTRITSFDELSSIVTAHKVGDKLTYTIVRGDQTLDIELTLEEKTN